MVTVGSSGHLAASRAMGIGVLFVLEWSLGGGELGTDSEGII
jgi:hypothetical protein